MKKFFRLIIFVLLFSLLLTPIIVQPIFADANFDTASNVTYTINASGITHVTFATTLTNNTDKYYASSYTIHLGFKDIQHVYATDRYGSTHPTVTATPTGEDITVTFNQQVLGIHAKLPFTISFDTTDVASQVGSIWEVNIPGLSNASDFNSFTVTVDVPDSFGKPTYIKPTTGNDSLVFTKDQLGKAGISIAFGTKQIYAFHLVYNIQNTELFPIRTEIALPLNTTYQQVEIDTISPAPQNVTQDKDGNWLAQYQLAPSQKLKIHVSGKSYVSLHPSKQTLSSSDRALYTRSQPYWQSDNTKIQTLGSQLKTPQAIYDYVVKTLHYDFARVSDNQKRLGALDVLSHPDQAVCLEFTDLFIALSRAAGIPAREIDGYAYTQNTSQRPLSLNEEVLHAWPEYYDTAQNTWVMVDPTWENTTGGVDYFHTFDFDHLALVLHGLSSTYPVPAGGYKLSGQLAEKDVAVSVTTESTAPNPQVAFALDLPSQLTAGLPLNGSVLLQNTGHVLFPSEFLEATSTLGASTQAVTLPIPPFGHVTLPLSLDKTHFLTNTEDTITIHFAGKTVTKPVGITAFSFLFFASVGGVFIAIFGIIISILATRSRRVPVP